MNRWYPCRFFYLDSDGLAKNQILAAGKTVEQIQNTSLANILNLNSFNGSEIVTNIRTGATKIASEGANDVFDSTPFIARKRGEGRGECCVTGGDSEPTPLCIRNATNPCACIPSFHCLVCTVLCSALLLDAHFGVQFFL